MTMTQPTKQESETLLKALDLTELPVEEQEELLLEFNSLVFEGTMLRLIDRMDEPTREAFEALLETDPSDDQVEAFLALKVPDVDSIVEETLADIRNDILSVTGEGRD
ncbi:MAG: DUF5663 domain-containing protein [Patescibacteria group bacterium]